MTPNIHELTDIMTVRLSGLLLHDTKFFARSIESEPLLDVAADAKTSVSDITTAGQHDVHVDTPLGTFRSSYMPWQWLGPNRPTLIYHHGSGEQPFDFGRFGSNSFRRLFVQTGEDVPANIIAVRAPFHDGSSMEYARAMGDLENFVGMLAASVGLIEALTVRTTEQTTGPVVAAGISLGGWAVNLHRATFDTADRYVPIFAGASVAEVFTSSAYRWLTAESARCQPERLREVLDFEDAFTTIDANDCTPLLARYDRIIEFDRHRSSYEGMPLSITNTGHVTGALATKTLREHISNALTGGPADG
uniref:hypothetical protein n=1 Tax=Haloprofundus sp. MHR1 TaxID=2572921 RepID=UPI001F3DFC88|nr:hypothetical protein [Haloprofundus sp. MHR1]